MTLPGRGPKSAKEHLADAVRSQSVNSAAGLIRTRPAGRATLTQNSAPVRPETDRFTVNWTTALAGGTPASLFTGHTYNISEWPFVAESVGSSIGLKPGGDDGGIYLYEPGVYAANIMLEAADIGAAAAACAIRFQMQVWDVPAVSTQGSVIDVGSRGGDAGLPGVAPSPATSFVFYSPGRGFAGGGLSFGFTIANLDAAVTFVFGFASVQRIS